MKNILIVEDDKLQANAIENALKNINPDFIVYIATDSVAALEIYTKNIIDLFILDVDLSLTTSPKNGIDIGKTLREHPKYKSIPIIYITSIPEMIHSAVNDVHCFNYITKPYTSCDINKALTDIMHIQKSRNPYIGIRDLNGITINLNLKNIFFIHTKGHTLEFHTKDGIFFTRDSNLSSLLSRLSNSFVQIHKSYIVNTRHISSYDKTLCLISIGKQSLPVGRSYKKNFEEIFKLGGKSYEY